jgi:hypothetical protein
LCLSGCSADPVTRAVADERGASVASVQLSASKPVEHHGVHAVYDSLSAVAQSFAGIRYDGRRFWVGLTNIADSAKISGEVARKLSARVQYLPSARSRLPQPQLSFERKSVSWRVLSDLRDSIINEKAFDVPLDLGVDVAGGIVTIEVFNEEDLTVLRRALATRPAWQRHAVVTRVQRSDFIQPTQLNGRFRPIAGGPPGGPRGCSIMVPAFALSQPVVVTASHCTALQFALDGGPFQQPSGSTPLWGQELVDAPHYTCGPWLNRNKCRRADVAAYTITGMDINFPEQPFVPGLIARPVNRVDGSLAILGSNNLAGFLEVAGSMLWAVPGETVEKIGNTSGWTYGAVGVPCTDTQFPSNFIGNVYVVCMDRATLSARPGDSGSLIFKDLTVQSGGNQILVVGIAGSADVTGTQTRYSSLNQIRQEIPTLCFISAC